MAWIKNFHRYDDWFTKIYFDKLDHSIRHGRFHTFKAALNLLYQRTESPLILETGCQRELDDWGAGCSTQVFTSCIAAYGGHLISVDNNPEHLGRSQKMLLSHYDRYTDYAELVLSDSVKYLKEQKESKTKLDMYGGKIDLLYLDSFDYPYGKLLDAYGGKEYLDIAIDRLWAKKEEELVEEFSNIILPCQEHCLAEIKAAPLSPSTIILIDDNILPGGGKARIAKQWLAANNFHCVLDQYQTLWIGG